MPFQKHSLLLLGIRISTTQLTWYCDAFAEVSWRGVIWALPTSSVLLSKAGLLEALKPRKVKVGEMY